VLLRDITVDATRRRALDQIVGALAALDGVTVVDTTDGRSAAASWAR